MGVKLIKKALVQIRERWQRRRSKAPRLLSKRILKKVNESCRFEKSQRIRIWFSQIYLPSWPSFIIVATITGTFIGLGHWDIYNLSIFAVKDKPQDLIAVHTGIGIIIFALVIFIAESLRDESNKDRARVLLKVSLLFPLTVAEILIFFGLLWGSLNWLLGIAVGAVGVLAIYSLSMLILTLLSPFRFSKHRVALLKDRIKKSIRRAINQRYGNALLFEELGEEIKLSYSPLSPIRDDSFHLFSANKTGTILDIRMDLLKRVSDLLETEANRNGYSFDKTLVGAGSGTDPSTISEATEIKYKKDNERHLLKKYKDQLNEEDKWLVCAKKEVIKDPGVIDAVETLLNDAFIIRAGDSFSEEIIAELNGVEDQLVGAISDGRITRVKDLARDYIALAESFLELLRQCGGGYSYEQAKKELSALWDDWSEMRWLQESVRGLLIKSIATNDQDIIREIAFLPIAICVRAIKFGDQYLFQKFIRFPELLYLEALEKNGKLREMMVERSYTHLKEMVNFYIEPPLEDSTSKEEIEQYRDFALPVFTAFLSLLQKSFANDDLPNAKKVLTSFETLYDVVGYPRYPDAQQLKWRLEATTNEGQREKIKQRLSVETTREAIRADLFRRKQEMKFGLAAWILKKYSQDFSVERNKKAFDTIEPYLPTDLKTLTEVFVSAHNPAVADFWGWTWWDIIPDGRVHSINTGSDTEQLYAIESLKILSGIPAGQIDAIQIPPSREIAFLAESSSSLNTLINQIASDPTRWQPILSETASAQTSTLKRLLSAAKTRQESIEKQFVTTSPLGPQRIAEFKRNFWKTFDRSAIMRNIAQRFTLIKETPMPEDPSSIPSFGFKQVADKEAFIDDWHVIYAGNGGQYGRSLAYAENEAILNKILGSGSVTEIDKNSISSTLESILTETTLARPVVFESLDHRTEYDQIKSNPNFIDAYRKSHQKTGLEGVEGYRGYLELSRRVVPVVQVLAGGQTLKNRILIADLHQLGTWHQYPPLPPSDPTPVEKNFAFKITDLNADEQMRTDIASQNLNWLQDISDRDIYLKQRVLIFILERTDFQIENPEAAIRLTVTDEAEE